MNVLGIIAEYNPFHNGHLYHIKQSCVLSKTQKLVVVMSGNFVQRGDLAIMDKHLRAKLAVQNGASLVLELPVLYASQSADFFAKGAIEILNNLGIVDYLSFGSESGNIEHLSSVATLFHEEPEEYRYLLKQYLNQGYPFPKARSSALEQLTGCSSISTPNDVLGVEYLKHLSRTKSNIKPILIQRKGANHEEHYMNTEFSSATSIRNYLTNMSKKFLGNSPLYSEELNSSVPNSTLEALLYTHANHRWMNLELFLNDIKTIILREGKHISNYFEVSEGLENRIYENFLAYNDLEEILSSIKTKRYTLTRIRHILLNILLNVTKETMQELNSSGEIGYARILAFDEVGRTLIRKSNKEFPLINKAANFRPSNRKQEILWNADEIADTIYYSRYRSSYSNGYVLPPVFVQKKKNNSF